LIWFGSSALALAAVVTAFFNPIWAWAFLAVPLAWILWTWLVLRLRQPAPLPEVSITANELLRKFGHYYAYPFAGAAYSSAASGLTMASMAVALIGICKGFWWGLAIGAVIYSSAAFLARQFNPTNFLVDDRERVAHEELVDAIRARRSGGAA